MNNKEFAQILLNEASELLTEGARYRKEIKDKDGNSSHSYGKKASKAMAEYKDDKDELRKGAARMKYYTTSSRPHRNRKTYTNMSKEEREQMYNDIVSKTAIDYTNYSTNKDLGKSLSDYNNDKLNRKMALIEKKNRKSQNESIAILLTEASELLNEGGGSRRTKADRQEKEKEFYIEKQKEMPSYETFKKIQDYDAKGFERENYARRMYDKEKMYDKYSDFNKARIYKNHANNAEKLADADFDKRRNKILGYDSQRAYDISQRSKRSLDKFYDSIMNYEKKIKSGHDKINNISKKLQNESIAVLLTEAAYLLNEGVKTLNGPLMDNHELNSRLSEGLTPEQAISDINAIQNQINILERKRRLSKQDKKRLVEMRNNISILTDHIKRNG